MDTSEANGNEAITSALLLGLCPLLVSSTSAVLALSTGVAFLLALGFAALLLAAVRRATDPPMYDAVAALGFVTGLATVELSAAISWPTLHTRLTEDLRLLSGAALLLPHTRLFAAGQTAGEGIRRALFIGVIFLLLAAALGGLREALGRGTLFADLTLLIEPFIRQGLAQPFTGINVFDADHGLQIALLVPGSLLMLGLLLALRNAVVARRDP